MRWSPTAPASSQPRSPTARSPRLRPTRRRPPSSSALRTASTGRTVEGPGAAAAVAKSPSDARQEVIDALVADGTSELAAEVANGSITQAQADAQKATVLQ